MGRGNWRRRLFAAAAAFGVASGALAESVPDADADPALAARIFGALGVRQDLARVVAGADAALRRGAGVEEADRRILTRIVARGFDPARVQRAAQHAFLAELTGTGWSRARQAVVWLETPLARRLHGTTACPGPMDRHARIVLRTLLDASSPRAAALARRQAPQRSEPPRRWDCLAAELSDAERAAAMRFAESETGRWLHETLHRAVGQALEDAARRTARELIEHFEDRAETPPLRTARAGTSPDAPAG